MGRVLPSGFRFLSVHRASRGGTPTIQSRLIDTKVP